MGHADINGIWFVFFLFIGQTYKEVIATTKVGPTPGTEEGWLSKAE